ncbi:DMT family transporter [Marinicrinis lubricantis]|uniref:DMT family transporter n=1 Tax=Marinicrinis lubricantis TaxID=2086470 RepID=A0ABW1IL65_9BACL
MYMLFAVIGGICIAVQAGVNGMMGKQVGSIEASFVSFLIGTVALFLCMIFLGKGNPLHVLNLPKWQLTGGLLGAVYVFISVTMTPKLGVATTILAIIFGQMAASTLIDHYGLISGKHIPIDWRRAAGLVCLGAALILFYKK